MRPSSGRRRPGGITAACLAGILLVLTAPVARAQNGTVSGQVTESTTGAPLPGVTLQVEGTSLGGGTAADGRYRIAGVAPGTRVIVARRLGYRPARQTVTVTADRDVVANFAMQSSPIALDQVVITGTAGAQERRAVGNAVSTINATEELEKSAAPNLSSLLNARAPGVSIAPRSGRVGAGPSIQIRGRSSLSLENTPLIYIDGVRVNNATSTGPQAVSGGLGGQGSQVGGRLNDINPDDIESIEVIKGPAAATIYGTEAANGVIQIITKKGAAGTRPQISLSVEQGSLFFRDAENRIETNYMEDEDGNLVAWNGIAQEDDAGRDIYKTGQQRRYNGSLSGGLEQLRYYVASSYENTLGIEPNNSLRQFGFHANLNAPLRANTDLATSLHYTSMANRLGIDYGASPLLGAEVGHILLFPDTRGFFAVPPEVPQELYDNKTNINRFTGSATLSNRPLSWYEHRAIVGLDYTGEDARAIERYAPPDLRQFVSPLAAGGRIGQTLRRNSVISADYAGTVKANLTSTLQSSTSIGGQFYKTEQHASFLGGTGFPGPGVETVAAVSNQVSATQEQIVNTTIGGYAEQQFALQDRLFLTVGYRVDNNSAFGNDFKWVTYPKVSASWVVNEEPFWKWGSTINTLRLRAAYGESGRQPSAFAALRTFTPVPGPGGESAVTPGSLGNPDLKPERGKEYELGFETTMFDRLTLDFTYFNKRTTDVIVEQPVAPSAGFPGDQFVNLGRVDNKGMELSATLQALTRRNLSWEITGKLGTTKDKIRDLGNLPSIIANAGNQNKVGYPVGGLFSRRVISADRDPTTGQATNVLCQGESGAGVACATAPFVFIGTPTPKMSGALGSTLTIGRNLRLYALADFKSGHKLVNTPELLRCTGAVGAGLCRANYVPEDYSTRYLAETDLVNALVFGTQDQYMYDASFVKLREVSATYTLPERWLRGRASLTLAGRELHTWTDFPGLDPEANANNAATTAYVLNQAVTPPLSSFLATFNISW